MIKINHVNYSYKNSIFKTKDAQNPTFGEKNKKDSNKDAVKKITLGTLLTTGLLVCADYYLADGVHIKRILKKFKKNNTKPSSKTNNKPKTKEKPEIPTKPEVKEQVKKENLVTSENKHSKKSKPKTKGVSIEKPQEFQNLTEKERKNQGVPTIDFWDAEAEYYKNKYINDANKYLEDEAKDIRKSRIKQRLINSRNKFNEKKLKAKELEERKLWWEEELYAQDARIFFEEEEKAKKALELEEKMAKIRKEGQIVREKEAAAKKYKKWWKEALVIRSYMQKDVIEASKAAKKIELSNKRNDAWVKARKNAEIKQKQALWKEQLAIKDAIAQDEKAERIAKQKIKLSDKRNEIWVKQQKDKYSKWWSDELYAIDMQKKAKEYLKADEIAKTKAENKIKLSNQRNDAWVRKQRQKQEQEYRQWWKENYYSKKKDNIDIWAFNPNPETPSIWNRLKSFYNNIKSKSARKAEIRAQRKLDRKAVKFFKKYEKLYKPQKPTVWNRIKSFFNKKSV